MRSEQHRIYLSLGSNVGDRQAMLNRTLESLREQITIEAISPFIETEPMYVTDQAFFLNAALRGLTKLDPFDLLNYVKTVEQKLGRIPRERYGPREIDVDILYYDDVVINTETLVIPHARIEERDFVKIPLKYVMLDQSLNDD